MLAIALKRRADVMPQADLRPGDAHKLEFADASFDTVVCTFSLCSIPDDAAAVAEMKRVLRPGGRLVAVEHVRSTSRIAAGIQKMLEPFARKQGDSLILILITVQELANEDSLLIRVRRLNLGLFENLVEYVENLDALAEGAGELNRLLEEPRTSNSDNGAGDDADHSRHGSLRLAV